MTGWRAKFCRGWKLNKSRLRISLTTSGKTLLFLAVFLLFAAQNTGNNLLYLMSSCFFACLVMAGISSLRNLSGLNVELQVPEFCFAGHPCLLRCRVEEIAGRPHHSLAFEDDFLAVLPVGSMAILKTSFSVESRGQYLVKNMKVFSCYPVDLFITRIEIPVDALPVGPEPARNFPEPLAKDIAGSQQRQVSGKEGDYWMQSLYNEGSDAAMINWNISARSTHEWVLIRSISFGAPRRLIFNFSGLDQSGFEKGLQIIAGLIVRLRDARSDALVWADSFRRGYAWLSVNDDFPGIVRWLACLNLEEVVPASDGDADEVKLAQLMVRS